MPEYDIEEAVDTLKAPAVFDLQKALSGVSRPEEDVKVFTDGQTAHELTKLVEHIAEVERDHAAAERDEAAARGEIKVAIHALEEQDAGGITEDPAIEGKQTALAELELAHKVAEAERASVLDGLNADAKTLVESINETALTFRLRGIARKQWELIDGTWRRKIKEPSRKDFKTDEDFENEAVERQIRRNTAINIETVQKAIVRVTQGDGAVFDGGWTFEQTEALREAINETEWSKLEKMSANLTFAHTLFSATVSQDADFLSNA